MQKTLSLSVVCSEFDSNAVRHSLARLYGVPVAQLSMSHPCKERRRRLHRVTRMLQSSPGMPIVIKIEIGNHASGQQLRAQLAAVNDAALGAILSEALGTPTTATTDAPWVDSTSTIEVEGDCPE